jgi:hypothetical protein
VSYNFNDKIRAESIGLATASGIFSCFSLWSSLPFHFFPLLKIIRYFLAPWQHLATRIICFILTCSRLITSPSHYHTLSW